MKAKKFLLAKVLPDAWEYHLQKFMNRNYCIQYFGDELDLGDCPFLQGSDAGRWDALKCGMCIKPFCDDVSSKPCKGCMTLTLQVENKKGIKIMSRDEQTDEEKGTCDMLNDIEKELARAAVSMLSPLASCSRRLYWSRGLNTRVFKEDLFFKPMCEYTNTYMAMDNFTIGICMSTVYGDFEVPKAQVYKHRLRAYQIPLSLEGIDLARSILERYSHTFLTRRRAMIGWSVMETVTASQHAAADVQEENSGAEEEEEEGKMKGICSSSELELHPMFAEGPSGTRHAVEVSNQELFDAISLHVQKAEAQSTEADVPEDMKMLLDEVGAEISSVDWAEVFGNMRMLGSHSSTDHTNS